MNKNKLKEKKAKIQFFLQVTDYIEFGTHFYTPEQEEEMLNYRQELREWDETKNFPTIPLWFPTPELYFYIFKK